MASVHFDQVSHRHPGMFDALVDFDLVIAHGEAVTLRGTAGSGAATALRLLAGLEHPDRGTIRIDDRDVTSLPPRERGVALALPHHALYPNLTVRDHLDFPLVVGGIPEAERRRRIADVASRLSLVGLLDRRPHQLTVVQRQRVSLGRAIVRRPAVLLLDDPIVELPPAAAAEVGTELLRLCDDLGTTTVAVVPDRDDALAIGHRTVHFRQGRSDVEFPTAHAGVDAHV